MTEARPSQFRRWFDSNLVFACAITAVFLIAALVDVSHHVMWRDEVRVWQIAAASPTPAALHRDLRYEGTPMLWYLIVWVLTKVTTNPLAMQIAHAFIAAGVVFTFARFAPFARWIKALFAFGYFPFFEYATITRSYALVFLLVLLGVTVASAQKDRPMLLALVLLLLTQVSIWGAGLAGVIFLAAAVRWLFVADRIRTKSLALWSVCGAIVAAGALFCYSDSKPGPGESFIAKWAPGAPFATKVDGTIATIAKAWIPIPRWTRFFWNTNILDAHHMIACVIAEVLVLFFLISLLARPAALLLLVFGMVGILGFTYFEFVGVTRHEGHLFMVLIAACWLASCSPAIRVGRGVFAKVTVSLDRSRNYVLGALLAVHVLSGIGANVADARLPFSASKAAADYIKRDEPPDLPVAGIDDYCVAPISTLLGRPIYSLQMRDAPPFFTQDDRERHPVSLESMFDQILLLDMKSNKDVLLLLSSSRGFDQDQLNVQFPASTFGAGPVLHVALVGRFNNSTVADETETLYRVHRVQ